jgi:hypothetical protein
VAWWRSEQWRLLLSSLFLAEKNNEREEENGESREAGLCLGFSPFGRATWRACDECARHAAAKGYGRSAMTSTPAVQTLKELLILPLPPFVTHKSFSFSTICSNQSCRATRDLQLCFKCQSLIRPILEDMEL